MGFLGYRSPLEAVTTRKPLKPVVLSLSDMGRLRQENTISRQNAIIETFYRSKIRKKFRENYLESVRPDSNKKVPAKSTHSTARRQNLNTFRNRKIVPKKQINFENPEIELLKGSKDPIHKNKEAKKVHRKWRVFQKYSDFNPYYSSEPSCCDWDKSSFGYRVGSNAYYPRNDYRNAIIRVREQSRPLTVEFWTFMSLVTIGSVFLYLALVQNARNERERAFPSGYWTDYAPGN